MKNFMDKIKEIIYTQETVIIIRPVSSNHIFDEEKYEKVESCDVSGNKIVLLMAK